MNEVTLPPAPNWYLGSILACANDGTVAWGSKNAIVVGKHDDSQKTLSYSIITNAHLDKVNSLAFSPEYGQPGKNLLLSGGDEHIIRVWDLDTMTAISSQSYLDTKQKVIGVDWSKNDPTLVCCISTEGSVISWNTTYSVCQTISLGKMTATCIACCPHKSNIVAIGSKSDLVYIVNLHGTGNIIYKLRGHDVEITSLSWCPTDINIFNESGSKDLLLASGAKDNSVFIWKAGGDGRYEIQLKLPNCPQNSHQHRSKLNPSVGNFTTVSWIESKYLLTSSSYGELLSIDLSVQISTKKSAWKLIHGNHSRGLFSIAAVPVNCNVSDVNWRSSNKLTVWTTGQDRQVICCTVEKGICNIKYSIPTHAGYIYCIASCPLETSRISYGGGDALLRLWNLSEPHKHIFDITCLWQKIMGRVTAIAWHPVQENILAFGTGEGRIGIYDTNNVNKPPILYRQHHRRTVYSLSWGPNPSNNNNYALYSCGDHELIYYQYEKPNEVPTVLIKKNCTEFCWKPDMTCMVIGYEDGSLSFRNNKLQPCGQTIFHLKKAVQCLSWHPDSTATDVKYSPLKHYFAAATNTTTITIFDMTTMINQIVDATSERNDDDDKEKINEGIKLNGTNKTAQHKVIAVLTGHIGRVVCLAWSPHISGYLVSGSCDSTAQVWNVNTKELLGTYTKHSGPIYSCMWSPLDPDFIITGSADFSLRIWRLSEQKVILSTEKLETVKNINRKHNKKCDNTMSISTLSNDKNTNNVSLQSEKNSDNSTIKEESKETYNREKKCKSKKCNYFSVYRKTTSNKEIALEHCLKLARRVLKQDDNKSSHIDDEEISSIFGTKQNILEIINNEKTALTAQGHHMMVTEMNVWSNNLAQQLQNAAKELRLNDFLVSLAPSLSVKMWQTMCETYATQLIQESNPTKAVCYLLSVHKIHRAIEVLIESKMFREAFVLAKCKLEPDDIILNNILNEWMNFSSKSGLLEEAAQCSILLGDLAEAAKLLSRRKDIRTLETAAELALLAKDEELSESILNPAVIESLLHFDFQKCFDLIEKFPIIQYRLIQVEAAEEMKKMREKLDNSYILSWLKEKSQNGLLSILKDRHQKINSTEYNKLVASTNKTTLPENEAMLWTVVSQEIALAVISPTNEKQIYHVIAAFEIISQYEISHSAKSNESQTNTNFLIGLLSSLDSQTFSVTSILNNETIVMYKSLRAYMCLALLDWLIDRIGKQSDDEILLTQTIKIVEKILVDGLDQATVKYWTLTSEISKLEASLISGMSNTQEDAENKELKEDFAVLLERLETIRADKLKFTVERVSTPSPLLVFSKAIELSNLLTNVEMKNDFTKVVNDTWQLAIS
ncbi:hypothetical protein PV327_001002 [Microctonus hyperodae]|uniref:Gem-associated protein 5 n=1 Tax=Microctonus hyperodae TaxID=165561 RepID=A0AA39G7E0_MICHY|nr:hypothetical protein PV327_001002 [Microctonus hyperodae]